jgi:hypothetical protein
MSKLNSVTKSITGVMEDSAKRSEFAKIAIEEKMSSRETRNLVRHHKKEHSKCDDDASFTLNLWILMKRKRNHLINL